MARVIYDEAASSALYRFLSLLRLLMINHPRVGAYHYAIYLGLKTDIVLGWNAIHPADGGKEPVKYMFISAEKGRLSEEHPDVPDDQINVIHEENLPLFEGSPAWQQVMKLADILEQEQIQGVTPTWIRERIQLLENFAAMSLRGEDNIVDDYIAQSLKQIQISINEPKCSLDAFKRPIEKIVDDFLSFRLTGRQAANILANLFLYFTIKIPSPFSLGHMELIEEQIDHLGGLASTIKRERQNYDLGSYSLLTYLGLLWAETSIIMVERIAELKEEVLPDRIQQKALYADELIARELGPCLKHPISLVPLGIIEDMRAQTIGITAPEGLYAGTGGIGIGPVVFEEVWPRIQAYSKSSNSLETSYLAYEDILSPALAKHLFGFLQTYELGK